MGTGCLGSVAGLHDCKRASLYRYRVLFKLIFLSAFFLDSDPDIESRMLEE